MTSSHVSRSNWQKGASIVDYIDGTVPGRLKSEFWVIPNWLGSPEDDGVLAASQQLLTEAAADEWAL